MDATLLGVALGLCLGLGLLVVYAAFRGRAAPRTAPRRRLVPDQIALRITAAALGAAVLGLATGWPVLALAGAVAGWQIPQMVTRRQAERQHMQRAVGLIEFIELLADMLEGSGQGLEAVVRSAAQVAPRSVRRETEILAAELGGRVSMAEALAAFAGVMAGIRAARGEGIPVSIATMIHSGNLDEFDQLRRFTEEIDAVEWGIDILCMAGALEQNRDLAVSYEVAAPLMEHARGGGYHGPSDGFACGRHLMTVTPAGKALKCGFYEDKPLGDARLGLRSCWQRLEHIPLTALECKGCPVLDKCAGGCRFRADHRLAPDKAMCAVYGINPAKMKRMRKQRRITP